MWGLVTVWSRMAGLISAAPCSPNGKHPSMSPKRGPSCWFTAAGIRAPNGSTRLTVARVEGNALSRPATLWSSLTAQGTAVRLFTSRRWARLGRLFSYENGRNIYFPADRTGSHSQWPFMPDDEAAMDEFIAGYGPLPANLAYSQEIEADRISRLLDRIGPAILVTHSASGPVGWLVADRRPGMVKAIVAVEPMGPPFATISNIGTLEWGLAAVPLNWEPAVVSPAALRAAEPGAHRLPAFAGLPLWR